MNTELKTLIDRIGIAEAEATIAEIKRPKKQRVWTRERCSAEFLRIIEGMELRRPPERHDVNLWDGLVNGERVTLFEQNLKSGMVYCRRDFVWHVFETNYSDKYTEVQSLLKDLLEEHLKWQVETTYHDHGARTRGWKNTSNGR